MKELSNYIPISRKLFEHHLWCEERTYSRFEAWIDLIQMARFEDQKKYIGNRIIVVKRGQVIASFRYLSERWKWSTKKVGGFLDLLISDNMVIKETEKETGQTVLTITKYDDYNPISEKRKQQGNRKETVGKQEGNEYNNDNIDNNKEILSKESTKKESDDSSPSPDFLKFQNWMKQNAPYCSNPKNFPSQITEEGLNKLKKRFTGQQVADIIEQIENRKDLRKRYTNLYKTVLNWAKREYGE